MDLELAKLRSCRRTSQHWLLVQVHDCKGSSRLVFQKNPANKLFAQQLPGAVASGSVVFSADCDRLSSSAGISLEGSKDSRLFPYFSEMTIIAVQLQRAGSTTHTPGWGWRMLPTASDSICHRRCLLCENSPLFKKKRLDFFIPCISGYNIAV